MKARDNKKTKNHTKTIKATKTLPKGYDLFRRVDLTEDNKAMTAILVWTIVGLAGLIVPMAFLHPMSMAFRMPIGRIIACILAMILGMAVYLVVHEGVHGIFIKLFSGENAHFGAELKKGMLYAGSDYYFGKWPYVVIALAPLAVWGVVLALLLRDIPEIYFWYLYALQIFNVLGAAGDLYIACLVLGMPKDVLAFDTGTAMSFYRPGVLAEKNQE